MLGRQHDRRGAAHHTAEGASAHQLPVADADFLRWVRLYARATNAMKRIPAEDVLNADQHLQAALEKDRGVGYRQLVEQLVPRLQQLRDKRAGLPLEKVKHLSNHDFRHARATHLASNSQNWSALRSCSATNTSRQRVSTRSRASKPHAQCSWRWVASLPTHARTARLAKARRTNLRPIKRPTPRARLMRACRSTPKSRQILGRTPFWLKFRTAKSLVQVAESRAISTSCEREDSNLHALSGTGT